LTGSVRIETSDGYTRSLSHGDQFLAGYTSGTGHRMEELNRDAYFLALVCWTAVQEVKEREGLMGLC